MSAMAVWGMAEHGDPAIWSMVALIEKRPSMTPAQCKAIVHPAFLWAQLAGKLTA